MSRLRARKLESRQKRYAPIPQELNKGFVFPPLLNLDIKEARDAVLSIHDLIDQFIADLRILSFPKSIERAASTLLNSSSYYWSNTTSLLQCDTKSLKARYNSSLISHCFNTKTIINETFPRSNIQFNYDVDTADKAALLFPLFDTNGLVIGVIENLREDPFTLLDEEKSKLFTQKFQKVAHLVLAPEATNRAGNYISGFNGDESERFEFYTSILIKTFFCQIVEFWILTSSVNMLSHYSSKKRRFLQADLIMNREMIVILENNTPYVDNTDPCPILIVPVKVRNDFLGIALERETPFSSTDILRLRQLGPLFAANLLHMRRTSDKDDSFAPKLQALLDESEILSDILDIDVLIPEILEKSCELLQAERCVLFLVDVNAQQLISLVQTGLDKEIRFPLDSGIAGYTATTGDVVTLADAYDDPRFNKQIDEETGYKTKTILSCPIFNNRGEIIGVVEMINRLDGEEFDEDDISLLIGFNVFCGISLDNANLYKNAIDLTQQVKLLALSSTLFESTEYLDCSISTLLGNSRNIANASRATLFLYNTEQNDFSVHTNLGDNAIYGSYFAHKTIDQYKSMLFPREQIINEKPTDPHVKILQSLEHKPILKKQSSFFGAAVQLDDDWQLEFESPLYDPIFCVPLISPDGRIFGALEICFNCALMQEDIHLLECYASFLTLILERNEHETLVSKGHMIYPIKSYIAQNEKQETTVPEKLKLDEFLEAQVFSNAFDCTNWSGIGFFKIIWSIFEKFELFTEFQIHSEKFFYFLSHISQSYRNVPYHNWRHAVDVTQFVANELLACSEIELTKFEIFALLIASVCHDANHKGFAYVKNRKRRMAYEILYKNQSVIETHHCSKVIQILLRNDSNLFTALEPPQDIEIWELIFQIILATDMAKHFSYVSQMEALIEKGDFKIDKPEHRVLLLQLLMKCGELSDAAREFSVANRSTGHLCDEFFRIGELEKAEGLEYISGKCDREHLDKPNSQIGFFTSVCLPLFQAVEKAVPALAVYREQVESNIALWKAQAESKESGNSSVSQQNK